jgi:hypothetical protein
MLMPEVTLNATLEFTSGRKKKKVDIIFRGNTEARGKP